MMNCNRWLRRLAALALGLLMAAPGALAAPGDLTLFSERGAQGNFYLTGAAADKGIVYLLTHNQLYRWQEGQPEAAKVLEFRRTYLNNQPQQGEPVIDGLVSGSDGACGIDNLSGTLYRITEKDGKVALEKKASLDFSNLKEEQGEYSGWRHLDQPVLTQDALYGLDNKNGGEQVLLRYDLASGECHEMKTPFIRRLSAYRDGKLLVLFRDDANSWDSKTNKQIPPTLAVWDPASDSLSQQQPLDEAIITNYDVPLMAYDAANDVLYVQGINSLYRKDKLGPGVECAYLMSGNQGGGMRLSPLVLGPERCLAITDMGVFVRGCDPAALKDIIKLKIASYNTWVYGNTAARAKLKVPHLHVTTDEQRFNQENLTQVLLGGAEDVDIFMLSTRYTNMGNLIEKGYLADLSVSAKVAAVVEKTYPMIKDVVAKGGKISALPIRLEFEVMLSHPGPLKKTGLSVPTTFAELVELVNQWNDGLHEEFTSYTLTNMGGDPKPLLTQIAMRGYWDYLLSSGQELKFDTPLFRELMQTLKQAHTENLEAPPSVSEAGRWMEMESNPLVEQGYTYQLDMEQPIYGQDDYERQPYLLKLKEDLPPATAGNIIVLAINPRSKNQQAALEYLEAYAESLQPEERMLMMPGENAPLPNPNYEEEIKWRKESIAQIEKAIKKAQGAEKSELESSLATASKQLAEAEKTRKYLVNEEGIQHMRSLLETVFLPQDNLVMNLDQGIGELFARYTGGKMELEQFIREADDKLRLMRLENQ